MVTAVTARNHESLAGKQFGNLHVIRQVESPTKNSRWECVCALCGSVKLYYRPWITRTGTCDCGCRRSQKISENRATHGQSNSPIHKKWTQMNHRVKDPTKPYIRRGITVCEEWGTFEVFAAWAEQSGFSPDLELDRIDNDRGYSPTNCRWVTHAENCKNKSRSGLQFAVVNDVGQKFPSCRAAANSVGKAKDSVGKAIASGYRCGGRYWFKAAA